MHIANRNNLIIQIDYEDIPAIKDSCFYEGAKKYIMLGHNTRLSRKIMNCPKDMVVDHINGDKRDNRKCNLRICTGPQNSYNRKVNSNSTSGYRGVTWHEKTKKWRASIYFNKKHISLGLFKDKVDAAKAYDNKAVELYGEYYGRKNVYS